MIEVTGLTVKYRGKTVLDDLSVSFPAGSVCAVTGRNGCGKTTLLKAVDGLVPSSGGTVLFNGADVLRLSVKDRAKIIAYLPQTRPVPRIRAGLLIEHGRFPHMDFSKRPGERDFAAIDRAVRLTGTADLLDKRLDELSGGEQQRVYMAAALAQETPVLLLDEPTSHLDPAARAGILGLMNSLKGENKIVIAVLHDLACAFTSADRVCVLDGGKIAAAGTPEELCGSPVLRGIFGCGLIPEEDPSALYRYKPVK